MFLEIKIKSFALKNSLYLLYVSVETVAGFEPALAILKVTLTLVPKSENHYETAMWCVPLRLTVMFRLLYS